MIWSPRKKVVLLWDNDAGFAAVPAYQHFDHVRHAAVLARRGLTYGFLDGWLDT
jgi:hypothetical protein